MRRRRDKPLAELQPRDLVTVINVKKGLNGRRGKVVNIMGPKRSHVLVLMEGACESIMVHRENLRKLSGRLMMRFSRESES